MHFLFRQRQQEYKKLHEFCSHSFCYAKQETAINFSSATASKSFLKLVRWHLAAINIVSALNRDINVISVVKSHVEISW